MRLEDLDYDLPEAAIAQIPLEDRASSKLLWLHRRSGEIRDLHFRDVIHVLRPGDLLVMNDTRVTALRLLGRKDTGGQVELFLLRERAPRLYEALAKPGKRLQPGTRVICDGFSATVIENLDEGQKLVELEDVSGLREKLQQCGQVPLPPYIHTPLEDPERYQTVYGAVGGSAAAPTAGLHFTPELLEDLGSRGIETARVTLDVGIDTFRPITDENPLDHKIHGETCEVPEATARKIREARGRIIAVGTTAVRTLESFAVRSREVESGRKQTKLFITPGYRFQIIDGMFTNFHMPRTTMLLMIGALAGQDCVRKAYEHALKSGYRFLSFGDSMLIL